MRGMRNSRKHTALLALGEGILASLSFLFYKMVRFGVQRLVQLYSQRHAHTATHWQILDGQAVSKPFNLLALMTSAPRWNTHALIALVGPLKVQSNLSVHAATAARSAPSWTVVVHEEPGHRIVASTGSPGVTHEETWQTVQLNPGAYRLALRYYHWAEAIELPAIEVDGVPVVSSLAVRADTNDFYHDLSRRSNFFYLSLHFYVCTLLRYRRWFPRSFVEREYLPAGNPRTTFYYGFLEAGTRLAFELEPHLLQTHDVYLTVYNRASFPVLWYPLLESRHTSQPIQVSGSYLVRIHRRTSSQEEFVDGWVRIHAQSAYTVKDAQSSGDLETART